jgi:hypothetical protein
MEVSVMGELLRSVALSDVMEAANDLADTQVEYAKEFQIAKLRNPGITDGHAHQIATEATNARVTRLQARYEAVVRIDQREAQP